MRQPFSVGEEIILQPERMASGGKGAVARKDGFVFFVEYAAPNEKIKCKVTRLKKNFGVAEIVEILEPSPHRRKAPCPAYGKCGGCQWQHLEYSEQLKQKQSIVNSTLANHISEETKVHKIASLNEWNYRNRVQVHKRRDQIGFLRKGSHELIPVEECLIAEESINKQFKKLKSVDFSRIEVSAENLESIPSSKSKYEQDLSYFSQVNSKINQLMISDLLEFVGEQISEPKHILDLYCGSGNLSFPLAKRFPDAQVVCAELNRDSVETASHQVSSTNIKNLDFHCADVSDFLADYSGSADLVVVDPPRSGCDKSTIESIREVSPSTFAYISCHPATLDRDLKLLSKDYSVVTLKAYDMFPQTDHIECLAVLKKV